VGGLPHEIVNFRMKQYARYHHSQLEAATIMQYIPLMEIGSNEDVYIGIWSYHSVFNNKPSRMSSMYLD
jgi:hypothetical protein